MIDLKELRTHPERMREAIRLRKVDPATADFDRWLALDERRRGIEGALQELNAEKNKLAQLGRQDPDNNLCHCYTLNDTGCAMGRYQQKDGSVKVPAALRPFMKKDYIRSGAAS